MRKPYLIRTPDFDPTSGGIRAMYGLYGWLLAKGEIALLNSRMDVPAVGIYPEIYHGNDLETETTVRWILQTPGVMASFGNPSPTTEEYMSNPIYEKDKFYVFSKVYDTIGVPDDHVLFLPILNLKVFNNKVKKRTKTCFLVGKGQNQFKHPEDSIELTREFARDQQALADLLNECHTLYCYDRLTAMMDIARLCGVRVQYYGGLLKEELEKYETGMNGLGYEDEEKSLSPFLFRENYLDLIDTFEKRLDKFIVDTQK